MSSFLILILLVFWLGIFLGSIWWIANTAERLLCWLVVCENWEGKWENENCLGCCCRWLLCFVWWPEVLLVQCGRWIHSFGQCWGVLMLTARWHALWLYCLVKCPDLVPIHSPLWMRTAWKYLPLSHLLLTAIWLSVILTFPCQSWCIYNRLWALRILARLEGD